MMNDVADETSIARRPSQMKTLSPSAQRNEITP